MNILKRAIAVSAFLLAYPPALFRTHYYKIPDAPQNSDLTVVFSGGQNRIRDALTEFTKNCQDTKSWLHISGLSPKSSLSTISNALNMTIPTKCKRRIITDSYAQNTIGNAEATELAIEMIEDIWDTKIENVTLKTSWYHLPRAYNETRHILPDTIELSGQAVGNCDAWSSCAFEMLAKESVALSLRQFGVDFKNPRQISAQFDIGTTVSAVVMTLEN